MNDTETKNEITAADVVAWFRAHRPEGVAVGCDTDYYMFFTARSLVDPTVSTEFADTLDEAIAELARKVLSPERRAESMRAEAAKLLAEAEVLVPAAVIVDEDSPRAQRDRALQAKPCTDADMEPFHV